MKKVLYIVLLCLWVSACGSLWGGNSGVVTVRRGDTLYSISRSYNVALKDMIATNHLQPPYTLYVGQKLTLPLKKYHTVQRGENLYGIAKMYNVDITELSRVNGLQTPYYLSVGQKLILPTSASSGSSYAGSTKTTASYSSSSSSASAAKATSYKTTENTAKTTAAASSYTPPAKTRKTKFDWPVKGTVISGYGNLGNGRKNEGLNIKAALGTNVKAADSGTVAYAGSGLKGFGNLILIKHTDGWITAYAHNEKLFVKKGQNVTRGEKIATVGSTGSVNTPQLHFEVRVGKKAVNPRSYLP